MVLLEFGIPYKLDELIMGCVSTVNYSLLLNRGLTPSFQAKKGLRQGDPMSPYLFVLAMEYLNRSLKRLKMQPDFNFHPRCENLDLIHICFADDLLLCCRADKHSIQMMLHCFEHFSEVSGLKANMEKSCLYIARVTPDFISDLIAEFRFTVGVLPFKYLGVPLSSRKLTISQCMPLVEKIVVRVKCWTSRFISYGGRLQLIKSVLFEMQTYWAQVFLLPKKIHTLVTSICRNYPWSGSKENSRKALVSWETLCKPKSAGGLNILDFYTWNKSAISKLLWAVAMKKDKLWVLWIHSYYIKGRRLEDMVIPKQSSWIVRKIIAAREWFSTGATSVIPALQMHIKEGKYSIKTAYGMMLPQYPKVNWKSLVLVQGPIPRRQFIIWLALHQRLSTVDRLSKWGIQVQTDCVLCENAAAILQWVGLNRHIGQWHSEVEWLGKKVRSKRPWNTILGFLFAATVYQVWMERNNRRFNKQKKTSESLIRDIALQLYWALFSYQRGTYTRKLEEKRVGIKVIMSNQGDRTQDVVDMSSIASSLAMIVNQISSMQAGMEEMRGEMNGVNGKLKGIDERTLQRAQQHIYGLPTWNDLIELMETRWLPPTYHQDALKRLYMMKQGLKSVEAYFDEFEDLRMKSKIEEHEEYTIIRFIANLN
ncbi:uncharacterized protein LOC132644255 [Lycium barbarum]|uniref:uncharacterized protein LOC132644255 n=1 Tax=Lycium barbarum TaxID=112863 RepID=UPI00293E5B2E|nr:uncharacterized protein LOC132644255 [Lycium barbarum]